MSSVAMPQLGESVSEGTVVRWLKAVGDNVAVDEPLFEVATDKVNTEIPSLHAGVLQQILVPDGTTVPVGTELARIGGAAAAAAPQNGSSASRAHLHSPVVRRLAREHNLDLAAVRGSGPGGRITRGDLLTLVASAAPPPPVAKPVAVPAGGNRTVPFSPLRARIAANVLASKRMVADVFSVIEADM
jgi:pyruvate dehydrogenase E2 component (dihydrolipoamide acetyltransferase)